MKKKKFEKFLCGAAAISILLGTTGVSAETAENISLCVNDKKLVFSQSPIMENDRVLVPMRTIFEALGCKVYSTETDPFIYVSRGMTSLSTEFGSDTLTVNTGTGDDREIKLDVPSKLVNGEILVPVRAVSEALDAFVYWDTDTKTVYIADKPTQHNITAEKLSRTIKSDSGRELVNIEIAYPVIPNPENDEFIAKLNAEYKAYAEDRLTECADWKADADALLDIEKDTGMSAALPLEYSLDFETTRDADDILSITLCEYIFTGGAHPMTARTSKTFDMKNKKKLELDDILIGSKDETNTVVKNAFSEAVNTDLADDGELAKSILSAVDEEKDNVSFLVTDSGLVLYFTLYQVAPYAYGYPVAKIPYDGNAELFRGNIIPTAASFGIIGGADGPTAIFVTSN